MGWLLRPRPGVPDDKESQGDFYQSEKDIVVPTTPDRQNHDHGVYRAERDIHPAMALTAGVKRTQQTATGVDVVIFGDQGFGTIGVHTGPNNGECLTSFNYPLTSPVSPGTPYGIAAGKTCVNPRPGLVTFTATTELGAPTYTKSTNPKTCGTVTPPCYTVTYTKKYSVTQKWNIWLQ